MTAKRLPCLEGQLPALESEEGDVLGKAGGEFESTRQLVEWLKSNGADLDDKLSKVQRAQAAAFTALIRTQLEPASTYTSWCESESFAKHMRVGPIPCACLPPPSIYPPSTRCSSIVHTKMCGMLCTLSSNDVLKNAVDVHCRVHTV